MHVNMHVGIPTRNQMQTYASGFTRWMNVHLLSSTTTHRDPNNIFEDVLCFFVVSYRLYAFPSPKRIGKLTLQLLSLRLQRCDGGMVRRLSLPTTPVISKWLTGVIRVRDDVSAINAYSSYHNDDAWRRHIASAAFDAIECLQRR